MVVNKERVHEHLRTKPGKQKLYNYISRFLLDKVDLAEVRNAVTLVVDRSKNKDEVADFNRYMKNQLDALLPLDIPVNFYHERSHENPGLQAVDLFCWGVFRKYEHGDYAWYREYGSRIGFETDYLRKGQKKDGPCYADVPGTLANRWKGTSRARSRNYLSG